MPTHHRKARTGKPTLEQTRILRLIAQKGPLIKSYDSERRTVPMFDLAGGGSVPEPTVQALIRHGWIVPQKDGFYDDAQTYVVPPAPPA